MIAIFRSKEPDTLTPDEVLAANLRSAVKALNEAIAAANKARLRFRISNQYGGYSRTTLDEDDILRVDFVARNTRKAL